MDTKPDMLAFLLSSLLFYLFCLFVHVFFSVFVRERQSAVSCFYCLFCIVFVCVLLLSLVFMCLVIEVAVELGVRVCRSVSALSESCWCCVFRFLFLFFLIYILDLTRIRFIHSRPNDSVIGSHAPIAFFL